MINVFKCKINFQIEFNLNQPLVGWLKIDSKSDRQKFPESFWKFLVYGILWGYCADLLVFSGRFDYFIQTEYIWEGKQTSIIIKHKQIISKFVFKKKKKDWVIHMEVPHEIKWLYFVETGFYLHSVYGTLFMDEKRKDFLVMLIHHALTMLLLIFSYGTR